MLVWYTDSNCTTSNSIFIPAKYSAIAFCSGGYFHLMNVMGVISLDMVYFRVISISLTFEKLLNNIAWHIFIRSRAQSSQLKVNLIWKMDKLSDNLYCSANPALCYVTPVCEFKYCYKTAK